MRWKTMRAKCATPRRARAAYPARAISRTRAFLIAARRYFVTLMRQRNVRREEIILYHRNDTPNSFAGLLNTRVRYSFT